MKSNDSGAGKGDSPRPINKKIYDSNYSKINWNIKNKQKTDTETATK